ncbi:MAG: threonine/serine dehydratase [Gemmatimonadales bacterium]|jgi:threonine dehydratase
MIGPRPTTIVRSVRLSERLGATISIASEAFQWTGSFKFRAAANVVRSIPHPAVITASSGNFGQAMAYACRLAGKRCTVVMPANSAQVKIAAVRDYGARVDLVDTATVRREDRVAELAAADASAYVASAYDDVLVIQGNATLGRELAAMNAQAKTAPRNGAGGSASPGPFDAIMAPVGGGGLAAGILTGLRDAGDATPVWGAEPAIANDLVRSLAAGQIVAHEREPQTIADGARTRSVGVHTWAVLQRGLAGAIEVSEAEIREGLRLCFHLANLKVEPTGAVTVGAMLAAAERFRGQHVCCVASGGNVDPQVFWDIIGSHSEHIVAAKASVPP